MHRLCLLLIGAMVLSGCSSAPAPEADAASPSASTASSTAPVPMPAPPAIELGKCDASTGVTYGVSGLGSSGQAATCPFAKAHAGDLSNRTAGIVEVTWVAAAGVTGAEVYIDSDHCWSGLKPAGAGVEQNDCNIAMGKASSSPIRVVLDHQPFADYGNDNMTVIVLADGVTTAQPFTIFVSVFAAAPVEGYTAIPS